jgi:predicted AlkP superfamily phosphohydrolase/phosphomutase
MYRKGREEEITRETIEITRQQTAITRYLMESVDWRITVSVYDATDTIGHCFWAYLDKNHPKYDAKLAEPVRQMVEEVHVELDHAVGELVEAAGSDCLHLVISDHGFGPVYYGVYLNTWLLEQKYMYFKKRFPVRARYWAYRRGLHTYNLLQLAKKLRLVKSVESAYSTRSFLLKVLKMTSLSLDDVDWERTRVYSFGNFGQLYLNLKGREPNGVVPPEEANELMKELVAKLVQLEDPVTHSLMFDHVYTKGDVFLGDAMSNAPDIVFFDEQMMYAAHRMFELGSNKLVTLHPVYSGHHKMDGIIFMAGRGVKFMSGAPNVEPTLIDIAPTILHYLGSPLPDDMDGRILEEFFETSSEFAERQAEYTVENGEARRIRVSVQKLRSSRSL